MLLLVINLVFAVGLAVTTIVGGTHANIFPHL
jgi:hypothetical protein